MSQINCDSCQNLRETSPEFVQNGVTDNIAASLKNNTGLNPSLAVLHDDCQDLNDINDCLIGRGKDEVKAYDVCDWKQFMKEHLGNLYETLKAIIAAICGLWTRTDRLCNSIDAVLALIRGTTPKAHPGTWMQSYLDKLTITIQPTGTEVTDKSIYHPSFEADILTGVGCSDSKRLGRWQLNTKWDVDVYPQYYGVRIDTPVSVGEVIGTIPRSAVPDEDYSLTRWRNMLRVRNIWSWYILNADTLMYVSTRGYVTVDGVKFNEDLAEYGEDTMVIFVDSFIGPSRTGGCRVGRWNEIQSYDA